MTDKQTNYFESKFLMAEATDYYGNVIPEIKKAIATREEAIDAIVERGGFVSLITKNEVDYYGAAQQVRRLQREHGIEAPQEDTGVRPVT